jgi:3-hydroxyacyl-CoA dehydrogenase
MTFRTSVTSANRYQPLIRLATNTSSLSPTAIAAELRRPARFVGLPLRGPQRHLSGMNAYLRRETRLNRLLALAAQPGPAPRVINMVSKNFANLTIFHFSGHMLIAMGAPPP